MANVINDGVFNIGDLFSLRHSTLDSKTLDIRFAMFIRELESQWQATRSIFVQPLSPPETVKIKYITGKSYRAQVMDPDALPLPADVQGSYNLEFPLRTFKPRSLEMGKTTTMLSTPAEIGRRFGSIIIGDVRRQVDEVLSALYTDTAYTVEDPREASVSVSPLANADAVTYEVVRGGSSMETDNHYRFQTNQITDGADNPFPAIFAELEEHPENGVSEIPGGEVVCFVNTELASDIQELLNFRKIEDPRVRASLDRDVLVSPYGGPLPGSAHYLGIVDRCHIVHWGLLPQSNDGGAAIAGEGYILAVTTGGDRPLAMRQDSVAGLQGLVFDDIRSTPYTKIWQRRCGYGGFNRVGALVMAIGATDGGSPATGGAYNEPSTLKAPLGNV